MPDPKEPPAAGGPAAEPEPPGAPVATGAPDAPASPDAVGAAKPPAGNDRAGTNGESAEAELAPIVDAAVPLPTSQHGRSWTDFVQAIQSVIIGRTGSWVEC